MADSDDPRLDWPAGPAMTPPTPWILRMTDAGDRWDWSVFRNDALLARGSEETDEDAFLAGTSVVWRRDPDVRSIQVQIGPFADRAAAAP